MQTGPCHDKKNICEHGSLCVPNFVDYTFQCVNCFLPYTGKYCNESGPTTGQLHQDITEGRNASCSDLRTNFNIPGGRYAIYPWRDQRNISVVCTDDGWTRVSNYNNTEEPVQELTRATLETSSNVVIDGKYRAHTSFLNMLESLIHFDKIRFICEDDSGTTHSMSLSPVNSNDYYHVILFLLGRQTDRPRANKFGISLPNVVQDSLLSSASVPEEKRSFKDVFVLTTGEKFSFETGDENCFNGHGNYNYFLVEVR
ncbi:uncharacterized protein [Clytia hemisphaerica]|uniref:uncharacterized protein n=1 Tax=Clytia hemisphaerica TaxID=252671 RepID=UPI0034D552D1